MATKNSSIRALVKQLGDEYRVKVIDFEYVVYRDFGNGFNVEISGMYTTSMKKKANIYLWHGDSWPTCTVVKMVEGVKRENIREEVEGLYEYSKQLISSGVTDFKSIFEYAAR